MCFLLEMRTVVEGVNSQVRKLPVDLVQRVFDQVVNVAAVRVRQQFERYPARVLIRYRKLQ